MKRIVVAIVSAALTASCATPSPPVGTAPSQSPASPPQPSSALPPGSPAPNTAAARVRAQALAKQASELLDRGDEEGARAQLEQAAVLDAENKAVACLLRGIKADPTAVLGRESIPYTVRSGETLGSIAKRALGDTCDFYLLARYNQIPVPRLLAAGQVIRIPGDTPLAEPAPAPKPRPPDARPSSSQPPGEESSPPPPLPDSAALREQAERHHRNAQAAFSRQDLDTAIREWDQALELDPGNELYRARREQAVELQKKLSQIPK